MSDTPTYSLDPMQEHSMETVQFIAPAGLRKWDSMTCVNGIVAPAGLDFRYAGCDAAYEEREGALRLVLWAENLQAQHAALLAAAVAQARADEREKAWTEGLHYGINLKKADYAPLVAAVAEFQRTYRLTHGTSFPSDEDANAYAEARRTLAALPLPPEVTP